MIEAYIGPNGFGKTYKLNEIRKNLVNDNIATEEDILFIESEILFDEEIKDTKDGTKTMEYIISEILSSPTIQKAKINFEQAVDKEITANIGKVDAMMDSVMKYNETVRTTSVIGITPSKEYKKLVSIKSKDFKNLIGSGQRMQFILGLVQLTTTKKYIFLDEPEKFSHPSMLNITAEMIRKLDMQEKNVYLATHSPKLLSMLDIPLSNIHIINDSTHNVKDINFSNIIETISSELPISQYGKREKMFYDSNACEGVIKATFYREFIETLFTRRVYICEGIYDKLFLEKYLRDNDEFYNDYVIFQVQGKFIMPLFIKMYIDLGIEFRVIFDEDDESKTVHSITNSFIRSNSNNYYCFSPKIESEIGFTGNGKNLCFEFSDKLEQMFLDKKKYNI